MLDVERRILGLVTQIARELHPSRDWVDATPGSSLQDDLGIDSLGRTELAVRIEQAYGIPLPDQVIASAQTPADLIQAVVTAHPTPDRILSARAEAATADRIRARPEYPNAARTLVDVLMWHAEREPERPYLEFTDPEGRAESLSVGAFLERSKALASGMRALGIHKGEPVALLLPTSLDFFYSFFGVILAGGVPVPLYPPARTGQLEDYLKRQLGILSNSEAGLLVAPAGNRPLTSLLRSRLPRMRQVASPEELQAAGGPLLMPDLRSDDVAFIQYTSGSTGDPKGVVLSHSNLLANIRAMGSSIRASPSDIFVSWLPLYHDMGLIGACLGTLYFGVFLALLSPVSFLARPSRWLRMIHRYRATLSAGPNFAYEFCASRVPDSELKGLDLSSWRIAFNGSEPVRAETLERFSRRFEPYGFKPEALTPVYGLAESTVGLAFPPLGRAPRVLRVKHAPIAASGRAVLAEPSDIAAIQLVSCGLPLSGHETRIVDHVGKSLSDRDVGEVQFRGPSSTAGYYRNTEATRALFRPSQESSDPRPWLVTGDLGFLDSGELFIAGRAKDVIIRAGRHLFPQEIEERIGELPGVRKGCVAAFGIEDTRAGTERIVIAAETRLTDEKERERLQAEMVRMSARLLDGAADEILLLPPRSIPKTSSGKLRRSACKALYQDRQLGRRIPRLRQWIRIAGPSFVARGRGIARNGLGLLYGVYAWSVVLFLLPLFAVGLAVIPSLSLRLAYGRKLIQAAFVVTGIRILVDGTENLRPAGGPAVFLSNHSTYLDVPALATAIPGSVHFVAKKEFERNPLLRYFFRRLGCIFVERFEAKGAIQDTRGIEDSVRSGEAIVIFPEGTFTRQPGLRPFRMGAFLIAARTGAPVVPIAIVGARFVLHPDWWMPRRGTIHVAFLPALSLPEAPRSEWERALHLRDEARQAIRSVTGEPDLREGT